MRIETTDQRHDPRTPAGVRAEGPRNLVSGSFTRGVEELLMRPPGAIGRPVSTVNEPGRASAEVYPAAKVRREGVVTGEVVSRRVGFENSSLTSSGRGASWLSETGLVGSSSGAQSLGSSRGRTSSHRAWMCRPLECGHSNRVIPVDRVAACRASRHGMPNGRAAVDRVSCRGIPMDRVAASRVSRSRALVRRLPSRAITTHLATRNERPSVVHP